MSKNFKNTLAIYLFFIVIILATYIYYSSNIYDSLTVVKSSQENKGDLNIKIPDKIILSNPYLGTTVISNKSELNKLLQYFNKICLTNSTKENALPLENTLFISGEIHYLNGDKTPFEISNILKLDGESYSNNSSLINMLRNNLKDAFYTVNNLESILSSPDNLITYKEDGTMKNLSKDSKSLLLEDFKSLRLMNDNKDFLKTDLSEIPKHHLTLYRYAKEGDISINTFYIDVYKDYVIIQYLGDENGKNIYLKGNLNEEIFK
ncbi:DUF3919 family protein [Clostridium perfringens]|uniref:DUF3919 family protein n=1 Tax=Clostridium perfringens TaxID=1502 RepID=UPI0039E80B14